MSVILASAGNDSTIKFWDALSGGCSQTISADYQINALEITNDKRYLAAGGMPIKLYDLTKNKIISKLSYDEGVLTTSLMFASDDNWFVTGSEDGGIKVWDTRTANYQRHYENGSAVNSVVIHPNQGEIMSCDQEGCVKVWDLGANKEIHKLVPKPEKPVSLSSISVSGNDSLLVSSSKDGDIYMWSMGNLSADPTSFKAHDTYCTKILLSSDAKHLATCSADKTAKIWNTSTLELETSLEKHKRWVWDCAFSADSAYLVTASSDCYVRLWDLATNEVVREYGGTNGHSKPVTCCALNDV